MWRGIQDYLRGGRPRYLGHMPNKVIPIPESGDSNKDRTVAERPVRVICHMGLGGGSYALDIWGRASKINPVPAQVLPFPSRPMVLEAGKVTKRKPSGRKEKSLAKE